MRPLFARPREMGAGVDDERLLTTTLSPLFRIEFSSRFGLSDRRFFRRIPQCDAKLRTEAPSFATVYSVTSSSGSNAKHFINPQAGDVCPATGLSVDGASSISILSIPILSSFRCVAWRVAAVWVLCGCAVSDRVPSWADESGNCAASSEMGFASMPQGTKQSNNAAMKSPRRCILRFCMCTLNSPCKSPPIFIGEQVARNWRVVQERIYRRCANRVYFVALCIKSRCF